MSDHLTAAPVGAPPAPTIAPPDDLSADALDVFTDCVDEWGERMSPSQFAMLVQACRLITLADKAEAQVGDAWLLPGARGHMITNPLVDTARQARAAAVHALKSANLGAQNGSASRAGAALAGARWGRGA